MNSSRYMLPDSDYVRDLNFMDRNISDSARYVSIMSGKDYEECLSWVTNKYKNKEVSYEDPKVYALCKKDSKADRKKAVLPMSEYMQRATSNQYVTAPNLTAYCHPSEEVSFLAEYNVHQLANRDKNKQLMFKYDELGDEVRRSIYDNRQGSNKVKVNSGSGAQGMKGSVLYDPTGHSTLTTGGRIITTTACALIERLTESNRHYWCSEIAINNIISIVNNTDYDNLTQVMIKYSLVYPSVEYTVDMITKIMANYRKGGIDKVIKLIGKLTPIQRAAFVYTGDLKSIALLNPSVVRDIITKLGTPAKDAVSDHDVYISKLDNDEKALLMLVCAKELNMGKVDHESQASNPNMGIVGATARNILSVHDEYGLLYKTFMLTMHLPPSVAKFPESIRKSVIASDTDSAIFTNQWWTEWYLGEVRYDLTSDAISAAITFIVSKTVAHALVCISKNSGVSDEHLRTFIMKNEYAFRIFVLTTMAKNYYAQMIAREGLIYKDPEWEIKGPNLKDSKAPYEVIDGSNKMIKKIVNDVIDLGTINLSDILEKITTIELGILDGIMKGDAKYFTRNTVKAASAYKNDVNPQILSASLWNDVFAPKYNYTAVPEYVGIKVNIGLTSKGRIKEWIDDIDDHAMTERLRSWVARNNRKTLNTIYIPLDYVREYGMPSEITMRIDVRTMIFSAMKSFYAILETIGVYMVNKNRTRLLSEEYGDAVLH